MSKDDDKLREELSHEEQKLKELCDQGIHSWNTIGYIKEAVLTKRLQQCDRCKVVRLVV